MRNIFHKTQDGKKMIKKRPSVDRELILGETYMVGWSPDSMKEYKLIQPTKKGFNFLNLKTSKCLLKQHFYAKGFMIKPLPKNTQEYRFVIWVNGLRVYDAY